MILFHQDLGEGTPIIILHGLFGSLDNWRTISLKLAENYRVIPVDLRNHGHSFHDDEHSYELMAEDIKRLVDHLDLPPAILIGHSMGGKAAMYFALNYPEKVSKLIVADIAPRVYSPTHNSIIEALNSLDLTNEDSRNQVDLKLSKMIPDFGTRQFLLKGLYRTDKESFGWRFNLKTLTEKYPEINSGLPKGKVFSNPTLFIKGENSNYVSNSDLNEIISFFPNADLVTIPKAGHWIHADAPTAFTATVVDFLE